MNLPPMLNFLKPSSSLPRSLEPAPVEMKSNGNIIGKYLTAAPSKAPTPSNPVVPDITADDVLEKEVEPVYKKKEALFKKSQFGDFSGW